MDDFFDQLRNYGKEFLDFEEEDDDQYPSEDEEQIEQEVIIEEPSEDKSRAVFEDLSEEKLEPIHEEYRITKKQNQNMSLLVNSTSPFKYIVFFLISYFPKLLYIILFSI